MFRAADSDSVSAPAGHATEHTTHKDINAVNHDEAYMEATIDSGAAVCVMPNTWFTHIPLRPSPSSEQGTTYRTASGEVVRDEGKRTLEVTGEDGKARRITCSVTGVRKMLLAVSRLVETGHKVVFARTGSHIIHEKTGKKIPVRLKNGVYAIRFRVNADGTQTNKVLAHLGANSGGQRQA